MMDIIGAIFFVLVFIGMGLFFRKKIHNSFSEEPDTVLATEQELNGIEENHKIGEVIFFKDVLIGEFVKFYPEELTYKKVEPIRETDSTGNYVKCLEYRLGDEIRPAFATLDSEHLVTIVSGDTF